MGVSVSVKWKEYLFPFVGIVKNEKFFTFGIADAIDGDPSRRNKNFTVSNYVFSTLTSITGM